MKIIKGKITEDFFNKIEFEDLKDIDKIILDVKNNGDRAVIEYCKKFDNSNFKNPNDFLVTKTEIEEAYNKIDHDLIGAIKTAIHNVREFAKGQISCIQNLQMSIQNYPESFLGHKIIPINKVLCYIPGGNYPLISSAVMGIVPAKVAGVENIFATSPKITPEVIVAANLSGADKIYKIGGAQAISAFAYGTENIEKADKIIGPGNKYVTYAKKYVFGQCGIDFIAGPSEVLIVADDSADAEFVAADILAQCEHDINARAYLISKTESFVYKVIEKANELIARIPLGETAKSAFENSLAYVTSDIEEVVEIVNKKAPEHLELVFGECEKYIYRFQNYGSLFIGSNCAEVFGDYCSGTNHILPTNQAARYHGGLSVFDFIKIQTYQKIDCAYAKILSETASLLAKAEGLSAHKKASELRGEHNAAS